MSKTWILIANHSGARIYQSLDHGHAIELIQKFEHPEGRKKGAELQTDDAGRSFDSFGQGRHATRPEFDAHSQAARRFAQELATYLERERTQQSFERLALAAGPQFLGELRESFPEQLKKTVYSELSKDFPEYFSDAELLLHLREGLPL